MATGETKNIIFCRDVLYIQGQRMIDDNPYILININVEKQTKNDCFITVKF